MKFPSLLLTTFASTAVQAVKLSTVFQYPNGTWLENVAPMHNGSLLVTIVGRAEVHMIDPTVTPATSSLLHTFSGHNAVLGITELERDRFAVAVGNVTASNTPIAGTWGVYTIDVSSSCGDASDSIIKVADLKDVGMINGITALNKHTLLLADSWNGTITSLNTLTRKSGTWLNHSTLKPDFSAPLPLGVNGVRFDRASGHVYYTNTALNLLARIPVSNTFQHTGPVEIITSGDHISQPDDFAVAEDGSVYLARPLADTLQRVYANGTIREIGKGGLASGATSVIFGKRGRDERVLYLSESGLEGGVSRGGGRVVRADL